METGHEPLGIQIDSGRDGGIFVSAVGEDCRASRAGIAVGDQLLEVGIYSFNKMSTVDGWDIVGLVLSVCKSQLFEHVSP